MDDQHPQDESLNVLNRVRKLTDRADQALALSIVRLDDATHSEQVPENARMSSRRALSNLEEAIDLLSDWIVMYGCKGWDKEYGDRFK